MGGFHLLLLDFLIPDSEVEKTISEKLNLYLLNFSTEFRTEILKKTSPLSIEIKSFLDRGDSVPPVLLEKFLVAKFEALNDKPILLSRFPVSDVQFSALQSALHQSNRSLQSVWYVKHHRPENFLPKREPEAQLWSDKFGEETPEKLQNDLEKREQLIADIQKSTSSIKWNILEINNKYELIEKLPGFIDDHS